MINCRYYFFFFVGIICAEGELWKEQRKFVTTTLKNLGMVKFGSKRDEMEKRIVRSINELIEVILAF